MKDEVTGEDYITDPDIMLVIDNGRILSDAATVKLADEMNFFARGGREVDPRVARKRGPLVVDPRDPFQHSGRATFFTVQGAGNIAISPIDWKREGRMPPGHFHYFPVPGDPSTGHGHGARHYAPFEPEDWGLPANWNIWP